MRTEQLYYAIAVAQTGSFSKAAEEVYIKQQSIYTAINRLESEIGAKLFDRSPRGTFLTEDGQKYIDRFRDILEIYEEICSWGKATAQQENVLRVGSNPLGTQMIQVYLDKLNENTLLKIKLHEKDDVIALLKDCLAGESDVVVSSIAENILQNHPFVSENLGSRLAFDPFYKIKIGIFVKADHPFAKYKAVRMKDLNQYPVISFNEVFVRECINPVIGRNEISETVISRNPDVHRAFLRNQNGVSLAPENAFSRESGVVFVPFRENISLIIGLFFRQAQSCDQTIQEFRRLLLRTCQSAFQNGSFLP